MDQFVMAVQMAVLLAAAVNNASPARIATFSIEAYVSTVRHHAYPAATGAVAAVMTVST
jgi:hypothetical protein